MHAFYHSSVASYSVSYLVSIYRQTLEYRMAIAELPTILDSYQLFNLCHRTAYIGVKGGDSEEALS